MKKASIFFKNLPQSDKYISTSLRNFKIHTYPSFRIRTYFVICYCHMFWMNCITFERFLILQRAIKHHICIRSRKWVNLHFNINKTRNLAFKRLKPFLDTRFYLCFFTIRKFIINVPSSSRSATIYTSLFSFSL